MRNRSRDREGDAEPLIIDLAAAAELPSSTEIHHWARDQRVFISSVMDELKTERRAVAEAIRSLGAEPVWFEEFGGRDADPLCRDLAVAENMAALTNLEGGVKSPGSPTIPEPCPKEASFTPSIVSEGALRGLKLI